MQTIQQGQRLPGKLGPVWFARQQRLECTKLDLSFVSKRAVLSQYEVKHTCLKLQQLQQPAHEHLFLSSDGSLPSEKLALQFHLQGPSFNLLCYDEGCQCYCSKPLKASAGQSLSVIESFAQCAICDGQESDPRPARRPADAPGFPSYCDLRSATDPHCK